MGGGSKDGTRKERCWKQQKNNGRQLEKLINDLGMKMIRSGKDCVNGIKK